MVPFLLLIFLLEFDGIFSQGCRVQRRRGSCARVDTCPELNFHLRSGTSLGKKFIVDAFKACPNSAATRITLCCPSRASSPPSSVTPKSPGPGQGSSSSSGSFFSSGSTGGCGTFADDQDRIVGGVEASLGAWPWMAIIGNNGFSRKEFFCGGTLISNQHVLTAAHCFDGGEKPDFVRVGEHDLQSSRDCESFLNICVPDGTMQEIGVERVIIHPQYRKNCIGPCNDIAILKLRNRVREDGRYVQHICLPTNLKADIGATLDDLHSGLYGGMAAGWGKTKRRGGGSNTLMQVRLVLGDDQKCQRSIGNRRQYPDRNSVLCAGDCTDGDICKDTCTGDSGGPIMMSDRFKLKWFVVGITSIGPAICGSKGVQGRYTNVNHFVNWIQQNMF